MRRLISSVRREMPGPLLAGHLLSLHRRTPETLELFYLDILQQVMYNIEASWY